MVFWAGKDITFGPAAVVLTATWLGLQESTVPLQDLSRFCRSQTGQFSGAVRTTTTLGSFRFYEAAPTSAHSAHCPQDAMLFLHSLLWKWVEAVIEASSLPAPSQMLLPCRPRSPVEVVTTTRVSPWASHIWGVGK